MRWLRKDSSTGTERVGSACCTPRMERSSCTACGERSSTNVTDMSYSSASRYWLSTRYESVPFCMPARMIRLPAMANPSTLSSARPGRRSS